MGDFTFLPNADFLNQKWTLVGSGITRAHQAWADDLDSTYTRSPSNQGKIAVRFPQNVTSLPNGAHITSVTMFVRAMKLGTASRALTVQTLSNTNTSRFTSRTLYLSNTITTYEVGTYTQDALNRKWTVATLNNLVAQMHVSPGGTDAVRVYRVWFRVNYHTRPNVQVTGPTGSQVTASPTLTWTFEQDQGDTQQSMRYRIFSESEAVRPGFNPATAPALFEGTRTNVGGSLKLPHTLERGSYYVYVQATSNFGVPSLWASRLFQVSPELPGSPLMTATPDSSESKVDLEITNATNLLSFQQASAEYTQDVAEYATTNCSMTWTALAAYGEGQRSHALTATASGTMSVISTYIPVDAEREITSRAQMWAQATARSVTTRIRFYNEIYEEIGTPVAVTQNDVYREWTEYVSTAVTPLETRYVRFEVEVAGVVASELHYMDNVGIMYGNMTSWSSGGHFSRNMLSTAYAAHPDSTMFSSPDGTELSDRTDVSEPGADSPNALRMTSVPIPLNISYVGAGTVFSSTTSGVNYTFNKPAVSTGDLMIAVVSSTGAGDIEMAIPDTWTYVNSTTHVDGSGNTATMWIYMRVATADDSSVSSWAATGSEPASRRRVSVVAYRNANADQFLAENVKNHPDTPSPAQSQNVYNPDSKAWRVAAFTARTVVTGTWTGATDAITDSFQYISFVNQASWRSIKNRTSYVLKRPAGVRQGDLMVATVGMWGRVTGSLSAPSGWTVVDQLTSTGLYPTTMLVLKRTVGVIGSEPTQWTGLTAHPPGPLSAARVTQVGAYRAAAGHTAQFISNSIRTAQGNNSSYNWITNKATTNTVTNNDGRSWSISAFACNSADPGYWSASNESQRRGTDSIEFSTGNNAMTVAMFDSGGCIPSGSRSRHAYWYNTKKKFYSKNFHSGVSWIGTIRAHPDKVTSGTGVSQSSRSSTVVGADSEWLSTGIYDTDTTVPIGESFTAATHNQAANATNMMSWVAILRPAAPLVTGKVQAEMTQPVDISDIAHEVVAQADNRITLAASFLGEIPGMSQLTIKFWNATNLISTDTIEAGAFDSTAWMHSYGTFDIPEDTTHVSAAFSVEGLAETNWVDLDKLYLGLGEFTEWRSGTGQSMAHPVWGKAVIQFADDLGDGEGFSEWRNLYGQRANPPIYHPFTGTVSYTDHTPIPLVYRKYRAATLTHGLDGGIFQSPWGDDSNTIQLQPDYWWLKNPADPTKNLKVLVKAEEFPIIKTNTANVFQPIGNDRPIVLSEGYKGDSISLTLRMDRQDWLKFNVLRRSGKTLFLQSDTDMAWWVRIAEDVSQSTMVTYDRQNNPIRWVEVTFVEVAPEE